MYRFRTVALTGVLLVAALTSLGAFTTLIGPGAINVPADKFFEFNDDGVLPSSQGAVYWGEMPEAEAFQVSGGLLREDTVGHWWVSAGYTAPKVFDHTADMALEFRARVLETDINWYGGAVISLFDNIDHEQLVSWGIAIGGGWVYCVGQELNFDTSDFHVYRLEIPANTDAFSFRIDGNLFCAGNARRVDNPGDLLRGDLQWGDQTSYGNAKVEWDYIKVYNHAPDTAPPTISVATSHSFLWPSNNKMQTVTVSGVMSDDDSGLNLATADFVVLDEYGLVQPVGPVVVQNGGRYEVAIPLQASRRGTDQDGRLYTVTIRVSDWNGNQGTASVAVTVPHDQRR